MDVELGTPDAAGLHAVVQALRGWQDDAAPLQLHPGDLGWFWRHGEQETAASVRTWSRRGELLAVGLLDGPGLLRLTTAPEVRHDDRFAHAVVADLVDPARGVLPAGEVSVETPSGSAVSHVLLDVGWHVGEPWTPLCRDLAEPVERPGLRVEVVDAQRVGVYTAVHRSAFASRHLTEARWHAMTGGAPYADGRSLLGYDDRDRAVAEVTVWSAGPGRPGLLEPMGVSAEHRGRGHGRAICLAAAAALRSLGSSRALVCTPSANTGAIATYRSAGYRAGPERHDRSRMP